VRLAIFSAFPQEIKGIVRNLKAVKSSERHPVTLFFAEYLSREVVVVLSGMGSMNAETALNYVCERYAPEFILSLGFGGALYDGAALGEIIWSEKFLLIRENVAETLELSDVRDVINRVSGNFSVREGSILTIEKWMAKSEVKKFVPEKFYFPVCDMETFFLARLSIKRRVPFLAVRAITDLADEEIPPEFLSVSDESGTYKFSRALRLVFSKPKLLRDIIRIGRSSALASNNLWHFLKALIEVM
jgi:adenosylhomocysteine nucleosidase